MPGSIWVVPALMMVAGYTVGETAGAMAAEWAPIAGPISCAGAVIYTVKEFLKRQREAAEEFRVSMASVVESQRENVESVVEAQRDTMNAMTDRLGHMNSRLDAVSENTTKLIDRKEAKDGSQ